MSLAGHMLVAEEAERKDGKLPAHFDADDICLKSGYDPANPGNKRRYKVGDKLSKASCEACKEKVCEKKATPKKAKQAIKVKQTKGKAKG